MTLFQPCVGYVISMQCPDYFNAMSRYNGCVATVATQKRICRVFTQIFFCKICDQENLRYPEEKIARAIRLMSQLYNHN